MGINCNDLKIEKKVSNTEKGGKIKKSLIETRKLKIIQLLIYHRFLLHLNPVKRQVPYTHTHTRTDTHLIYYLCSHMCQMLQATEDSK